MYSAYITKIKNVHKHSNADRLNVGECFGNQVVVSLDTTDGELGIYFPTDGKLSLEFLQANDLIARKDPVTGERAGGFFDENGRVRTQKFRGEKSDGFFCPLSYLDWTGVDITTLKNGTEFTEINSKEICKKYVPRTKSASSKGPRARKDPKEKYPIFHEHIDTAQLAYNKQAIKPGQRLIVTEKVHGTSQRTSHTLQTKQTKWGHFLNNLLRRKAVQPKTSWAYVCGTRRVVLNENKKPGYYTDETFRQKAHNLFVGKLHKGETVYYEVCGWAGPDTPVMGKCSNERLKNHLGKEETKAFIKTYGETTTFTYGCPQGESRVFVYRMTLTNEEGFEIDYDWDTLCWRCEQMGVDTVPLLTVLWSSSYVPDATVQEEGAAALLEDLDNLVSRASTVAPTHIMEGCTVRIDGSKWKTYKHKSFEFKVLEGIIKDLGEADMEEVQEEGV